MLLLQGFDVFVLGLNEVVKPVYFLSHQCYFVLEVLEVDLYVFKFVDGVIVTVKLYAVVVEFLVFIPDQVV